MASSFDVLLATGPAPTTEEDRPFWSDAYEVGRQAAAGFAVDLPRMAGQALRRVSPDQSSFDELGRSIVESADERAAGWEPDLRGRGLAAETFIKGARAVGPMAPAIGAAFLPGGQFLAPAVAGSAFGLSAAQETEDKLRLQGIPDEQATEAGMYTGLVQGPLEALASVPLAAGLRGARMAFGRQTMGGTVQRLTDPSVLKPFAKNFGLNMRRTLAPSSSNALTAPSPRMRGRSPRSRRKAPSA